jgi:hypothetical protein
MKTEYESLVNYEIQHVKLLVATTAFTRVIWALFFLVWPLKNRGA